MMFTRSAVLPALLTLGFALTALPPAARAQVAGTANFPTSAGNLKVVAVGYRASNLLNSPVYNIDGHKMGKVIDIIVTQQAAVSYFILDVGGFLGIGSKQIAVPANAFKVIDKKVVLPGVTVDELKKLPTFHFSSL
jgi:sporulation protein YlmC with PRC-barrel domain